MPTRLPPDKAASSAELTVTERANARWRNLWLGALLLGSVIFAYLPALNASFLWNDSDYVTAPELRSLSGLGRIWFELGATEQYYPLLHSFFWVQQRFFGDSPVGYHCVNLLLHAGAALLLALLLKRLLRNDGTGDSAQASDSEWIAWLAAALFALHPVHVASVAWITEQKNTLSLLFYLGAFLAYLRFTETRRSGIYAAALGLFLVSILCKTATVTLPAAILVVQWWRQGRLDWRKDIKPLLPWLIVGAAAGLFTSWVEKYHLGGSGLGAKGAEFDLTPAGHLLLAGRALWFYLGSLAWPFDLNFMYPRWELDGTVWWQWLFPVGVVATLAGLWALRHRSRAPFAVALLFAGTLFPVLGFVNLYGARYSRVWDHWQYLADLAPLALAAAGTLWFARRFGAQARNAGIALSCLLCLGLGILTWQRCGDFQDNETLYRTTLARNPDSWMAHNNLGELLARSPEGLPEALNHYAAAVRLSPTVPELHFNHANALAKIPERLPEAVAEYEAALRLDPDYAMAHNALGNVLTRIEGRLPEAVAHYEKAIRLVPTQADLYNNLGTALLMMDRAQEAVTQFEAALQRNPDLPLVHMNLAAALESLGRSAEAAAHVSRARELGFREERQ